MYTVHSPRYRLEGEFCILEESGDCWSDARFTVTEYREFTGSGLHFIRRQWKNTTSSPIEFQPVFEAETDFPVQNLTIPCVNLNGNNWGSGLEPKGFTMDGEPWVFAGSRCSIPSCTISENSEHVFALFASKENNDSLLSSCSVFPSGDGHAVHRILYPIIEEPLSYIARDTYRRRHEEFIRLCPGETIVLSTYCFLGKPKWRHYGIASLLDAINDLFPMYTHTAQPAEKLWHLSILFAKALAHPVGGRRLLCIGFQRKAPFGEFLPVEHYEIGWCGQNLTFARMLIRDFELYGHQDSLTLALDILTAWSCDAVVPTGLLAVHYEKIDTPEGDLADTSNLGSAALEFLRCYLALQKLGIEKTEYLRAAEGICSFFIRNRNGSTGFGKIWNIRTGECVIDKGTIGSSVILALTEMYQYTHEDRWLYPAQCAFEFYDRRDLQNFRCTAGALDTDCIDKESSVPMILSALNLYDITKKPFYLDAALRAAYYFSSWMYCWNIPYPSDSDFKRYGFSTCGATAVSVQHHHVDAWGMCLVPAFLRLGAITDDDQWCRRAKAMWDCYSVCVSENPCYVHGCRRPAGSQNEGWMHTRWDGDAQGPNPGSMNDWLVAWPAAFRLAAIDALRNIPDKL